MQITQFTNYDLKISSPLFIPGSNTTFTSTSILKKWSGILRRQREGKYGHFPTCFDTSERDKTKRISEIRREGKEPIIELVVHGIEDDADTVRRIEASIIDLYNVANLTTNQRGYHSREFGRMSIDRIIATYAPKRGQVSHPVLAFRINKTFHYGITPHEMYDYTRHSWKLGRRREGAQYAFTVYQGVVQEVYQIDKWLPQNSTPNLTRAREPSDINTERWEFVGRVAPPKIRNMYLYLNVAEYFRSNQLPYTYINC